MDQWLGIKIVLSLKGLLLAAGALGMVLAGLWLRYGRAAAATRRAAPAEDGGLGELMRLGLPAGVLVAVLDGRGRVQLASHKAPAALGLADGLSLRGKDFTALACWDEPAESRHALARALLKAEMGRPQHLVLPFVAGVARKNLVIDVHSLSAPGGTGRYLVVTVVDLSALNASAALAPGAPSSAVAVAAPQAETRAPVLIEAEQQAQRDSQAATRALVDSMLKLLPTAKSLDEALKIVASYLARLFPGTSGTLYMPRKGASGLHSQRAWGSGLTPAARISADDCWTLRHGELHWVDDPEIDLCCGHHPQGHSVCVPLAVRGEVVGVLALGWTDAPPERARLEFVAEPLASALAQAVTHFALREQATRDPLTGLLNRQVFDAEFGRLVTRSQEDAQPASVLMIDIDHFKAFNDRYGHDAGDHVLKSVAARILQTIRTSDLAFRFGGEEIVVLLPCCGTEEAVLSAHRIQKILAEQTLVNRGERLPPVTVSVGVATYPHDGETAETLFLAADAGVYAAKAAGRNAVVHRQSTQRAA